MLRHLLLLFLFLNFNFALEARGPAIEPGKGLSIDHYDHSKNKNDPGFNWKQSNVGRTTEGTTTATKTYRRKVEDTSKGSLLTNLIVTSLVIVLPIFLWFTVLRKLGESEAIENDAVVNLDQYRKDSTTTTDDHDDNIPKAS